MCFKQNLLRCFILIFFALLTTLSWQNQASGGELQLGWTDNADNEDGFKIERKIGTTGTYAQTATVGANVTSYTDVGLVDGATYCYRVAAFNSAGSSAYTTELCAPARPTIQNPNTAPLDFDGDGTSDILVFRNGAWLFHDFDMVTQIGGVWTGSGPGCMAVPMDYDGDGRVDFTEFCNGAWHFYNSDGSYNRGIWTGGVPGDLPVPADYDGNGVDDVVVFRNGAWLFFDFATGAFLPGSTVWTGVPTTHIHGGTPIPVPMDYDGDGAVDFTVYSGGAWHFYNFNGSYNRGIWTGGVVLGDQPVPADYDGDGVDDVVVFRGGAWIFFDFATGAYLPGSSVWTGAPPHIHGGTPIPVPMDYDGDGAVDFTVYSGGAWHFYNFNGSYNRGIWTGGVVGDRPISRRLLP